MGLCSVHNGRSRGESSLNVSGVLQLLGGLVMQVAGRHMRDRLGWHGLADLHPHAGQQIQHVHPQRALRQQEAPLSCALALIPPRWRSARSARCETMNTDLRICFIRDGSVTQFICECLTVRAKCGRVQLVRGCVGWPATNIWDRTEKRKAYRDAGDCHLEACTVSRHLTGLLSSSLLTTPKEATTT